MRPLRGLQETRVATREESGVLGFPSRRRLTPRVSLECNPEIPAFPGEDYYQYMASTAGTEGHVVEGGGWGPWPGAAPGAGTLQAWINVELIKAEFS